MTRRKKSAKARQAVKESTTHRLWFSTSQSLRFSLRDLTRDQPAYIKKVPLEVEKGVEGRAYGKRWKDDIFHRKHLTVGNPGNARETEEATGERQQDYRQKRGMPTIEHNKNESGSSLVYRDANSSEGVRVADTGGTVVAVAQWAETSGQGETLRDVRPTRWRLTGCRRTHPSTGSAPNLYFRFPDTAKGLPPPSSVDVERPQTSTN